MLVAVILASGRGTRLRPLSTDSRPKQYLKLISGNTLVEDTVDRVKNIVSLDNIFIVINEKHEQLAKSEIPYLKDENFIVEPHMKETLASMSHAVSYISKLKGDKAKFLFLPSDHYIKENDLFEQSINEGLKMFDKHNNFVLYGLIPTDPNTNYGYIKTKDVNGDHIIESFIEKPKLEIAKEIYNKNNYFWNNAIMILNKDLMFNAIKDVIPSQYDLLTKHYKSKITTKEYFDLSHVENFSRSILEEKKDMVLIPVNYTWYDIGNFDVLFEVLKLLNKTDEIKKIENMIK